MNDYVINRIFLWLYLFIFMFASYRFLIAISAEEYVDVSGFLFLILLSVTMIKNLFNTPGVLIHLKKEAIYTEEIKCTLRHKWKKEFDGQGIIYFSCKRCQSRMVRQQTYSKVAVDWDWLRRVKDIIDINETQH